MSAPVALSNQRFSSTESGGALAHALSPEAATMTPIAKTDFLMSIADIPGNVTGESPAPH